MGGSERTRVVTMKALRVGFIVGMTLQMAVSLAGDPASREPGRLRDSWQRFRRTPMFRREVWDQLCAYDRPGFHPDDFDTEELVDRWQAELFGDDGRLTPLLATAAE